MTLLFVFPFILLSFIPAGMLLLGLVLTLSGTQRWWLKLLGVVLPIGLPLLAFYVYFLPPHREQAVVVIPADFRGEVDIVQNEPCGPALPRLAGKLTITVPRSGLVVTSSSFDEETLAAATYYLVNERGQRIDSLYQLEQPGPQGTFLRPPPAGQRVRVLTNTLDFVWPANLAYVPDERENAPSPGAPLISKVVYHTFTVVNVDGSGGQHQSPTYGEKLRLGYGVPTGCDRFLKQIAFNVVLHLLE